MKLLEKAAQDCFQGYNKGAESDERRFHYGPVAAPPKRRHTKLQTSDVEVLDRLVLHAICAKRSDVILCMGEVKNSMSYANT